jgi:hypothetical protein
MEVITIESKGFKDIIDKIEAIAQYVYNQPKLVEENFDEMWVDNFDVCTYLKISQRTLQRLRTNRQISYSIINGKSYYTIGEIKRLLNQKLIKSTAEKLNDLVVGYQLNSRINPKK